MRAVVQRVKASSVLVENKIVGKINTGLNVLLGISKEDDIKDIEYLVNKIINLRIFEDEEGKMNLSLLDINPQGELLVISQFTLYGDCRKGKRPSYDKAANPSYAKELYEEFVAYVKNNYNIKVETGVFQADMQVEILNDGPVTLILDSKKEF